MKSGIVRRGIVLLICGVLLPASGRLAAAGDPAEERRVLETLETLFQAYPKKDNQTLNRIYHADVSYGHSNGVLWTKAEVLDDANNSIWESVKMTSSSVRVSGPVAVVRAVVDLRTAPAPSRTVMTVAGMHVLYVLVKGSEGWQVIARQATRVAAGSAQALPAKR